MHSSPHKFTIHTMKYYRPAHTFSRLALAGMFVLALVAVSLTAWRSAALAALQSEQPQVGPGVPQVGSNAPKSALSNNKAGSVLFFPKYTSDNANPSTTNTLISLTNTNPRDGITVRVFFVRECTTSNIFVNLAGNQTRTLLASSEDPGKTGHIVAVAVNSQGLPTQFNWLIGSASLRDAQGNESTYNAIGVARRKGGAVSILEGATSAEIKFNDTDYDRLPQLIALDQIAPQAGGAEAIPNAQKTNVAVFSPLADLTSGAQAAQYTAIAYDQSGRPYPQIVTATCGLNGSVSSVWTSPSLDSFITEGRPGWGTFAAQIEGTPVPVLGLSLTEGVSTPQRSARAMQVLGRLNSFVMKMPLVTPPLGANDAATSNLPDAINNALGASEMKAGSVLIFPRYTSGIHGSSQINITNTHPTQKARVRVFFTGLADATLMNETIIQLFPNQTTTLNVAELAANQKGWILAMAIDNRALPLNFNFLIGSALVREQNGQAAGYNALAVAKNNAGTVPRNDDVQTSDLKFNDEIYDRLPATLAIAGLPSQLDNQTILGFARPPANILDPVNTRGSVLVTVYDELLASASATAGQTENRVGLLRTNIQAPPITNTILKGHRGWMKLTPGTPIFAWTNNTANATFATQAASSNWTGGLNGGTGLHILATADSFVLKTVATNPNNHAPTANFESIAVYNEARGPKGVIVRLDGRVSTDPDVDDPLSYKWFNVDQQISTAPVSDYWLGVGSHVIKLLVTDGSALTSEPRIALVEVQDSTAPFISGVPSNITKVSGSAAGAAINFPLPFAYDMVDGKVQVTASKAPGSVFPIGKTTVTFRARDNAGNERTAAMTVTVTKGTATLPTQGGIAANKVPYMSNLNDLYVIPGKPRLITLQATDEDSDPVSFSLQNAPSFVRLEAIDPIARKATLLITAQQGDQAASTNVRIVASDNKGGVFTTLPFQIVLSDVENDETGSGQGPGTGGGGGDDGGNGGGGGGGGNGNNVPVARAAALPAQVQATSKLGADIPLDGSQSSDADLDPLSYVWKDGETVVAQGALATVTLPVGVHSITLTVSDGKGGVNTSAAQTVEVLPRPLTILSASPAKIPQFNTTTVTITGTGFNQGTQVRFDCSAFCQGGSQITATTVSIEEDKIVLSVKTTSKTPLGNRDCVLSNPDGKTAKLSRSNYVSQ